MKIIYFITTLLLALIMTTGSSAQSLYDFTIVNIDGEEVSLSDYKGKVVLIVNVASFCGYTRQYTPLEKIYKTYSSKGLVILGVPSNDFGAQEPGTNQEIKKFCSDEFNISFPLFAKAVVKGPKKTSLFKWLTGGTDTTAEGEIRWNFEKFLIGRDGGLVARFKTDDEPDGEEMVEAIETSLAK